ncbi:N-acetylmuramoyl-L-alanine amidase [Streptomyces sp. N50]|uniref:N-acetylmuramoyl-L-alanine amidase n=1 Tax=Streptomyces sp. N50 TaxID=3081765 RepID=UPI0029624A2D|nr:N-acetylmuramoyl-L-alanine amidase [Streptomyces sp. N50]WOX09332.1 N-acetylmuramoyl-L-alanine amidase [Streptomyces sp. N50]
MSYVGPDFDPPQPRRPRRGPLTVALAALVPGALIGWFVYEAVGSPGDNASAHTSPTSAGAPVSPTGTASNDDKPPGPSPLKGKVVVIDPGHNVTNFQHSAEINRKVDIGTNWKECDTTGTSTNAGYSEAQFTMDVSHRLKAILEKQGVTVKLTHDGDSPAWGPCVDQRAKIGNDAHADAAISIHADGAPAGDRGFHVILPASVHAGGADTRAIVGPSAVLGKGIAGDYRRATGEQFSNYIGEGTGLVTRKDLGGLNLSTVPKVFIECGNMRDSNDAALLTNGAWRQKAAQGISEGIVSFLRG